LVLECHFCNARYSVNVQGTAEGHAGWSSRLATARLNRELALQAVQSPYPCPNCGKLDTAEAEQRANKLNRHIGVAIAIGAMFGAFLPGIMLVMASINPNGSVDIPGLLLMGMGLVASLWVVLRIRKRHLHTPFDLNSSLLISERQDPDWSQGSRKPIGNRQNLRLGGWIALFVVEVMFAVPLAVGVGAALRGAALRETSWLMATGLAAMVALLFLAARTAARNAGRFVRWQGSP
jgi:hypothetical protein